MSELLQKVENAIVEVRPSLQSHGGDIEFIELTDEKVVKVKLKGACNGCPMAQQTLKQGVEAFIKEEIPEITSVESV